MNPNEPTPKDAATIKAEKDKRNHDRLAAGFFCLERMATRYKTLYRSL